MRLSTFSLAAGIVTLSFAAQAQQLTDTLRVEPAQRANHIRLSVDEYLTAQAPATMADTIALMDRTAIVLSRDGRYVYEGQWQPFYPLNVIAEDGEGARPRINAVAGTEEAPRWMRSVSGYILRGLAIESEDTNGEQTDNAPIRPRGNGETYVIEDCVLSDQRFEVLRTDAENLVVYMIDNIIPRNYQRNNWAKNGGLWFQNGNPVDSIIFRGNTYYNTPGRLSHSINGSRIAYQEWTHNTIYNVGGQRELNNYGGGLNTAVLDLGTADETYVRNNLFYNVGFMGVTQEFEDTVGIFNWYPNDTVDQVLVIENNNIYSDPALSANVPDTAAQIPMLTAILDSVLAARGDGMQTGVDVLMQSNISEELTFAQIPSNQQKLIDAVAARWAAPSTAFNDPLVLDELDDIETLDFSYSEDAASYSAGTDGLPLGALRWFPDAISSVRDVDFDNTLFALSSSFPNPVGEQVTFLVNLEQAANVRVQLFDVSGTVALSRDFGAFAPGAQQQVQFTNLNLPGGVYFALLTADTGSEVLGASTQVFVR